MKRLTLILFVFTFLTTCKKNNSTNTTPPPPPPPPSNAAYELTANTFEIDSATLSRIQSVDSTTIIFSGNTLQLQSLKTGNIIISGVAKNAPFGFLRKIANIQINGNTYTITTTDVPLTDAFKKLHVDYTKSYSLGDTLRTTPVGTTFSIDMPNIILYDADGNNTTTSDQIKVNGNLTLTPEIHVKIDIGLNGILPTLTYAKIECGFESVVNQTVTAGGSLGSISKKINIFSKPLALFIIPGTPLVVVPNLRVSLGADASINVDVVASEINTMTVNSYLEYNNSSWDTGYTQTMQNEFTFSGINGYANAKVYVEPAIDFKLYNSNWAKGSITAQAYLKASGQISPTPDCELRAGVSAGAEANLQLFAWSFTAASYPSIFDYSKVLYTCSSNIEVPTIVTTDITNVTTTSSSSGGNITSDGGSQVTGRGACWGTSLSPTTANTKTTDGTGTGSFTSSLTGLTPNTTYYVRAYATNSSGTAYGNEVSFKTAASGVTIPMVTTTAITGITQTTALSGGTVTSDGNATVTAHGVCWNTSSNPTIANNKTTDGTGVGSFTSSLTGLIENTFYYVRAYATNSAGTAYGNEISFTAQQASSGTVTDIDGNVYHTVTIGTQVWMVENLKTSRYRNGDNIPQIPDATEWAGLNTGAWCLYNSDYNGVYGKLYNWYVVNDPRGLCPSGWHVPTATDWTTFDDIFRRRFGGRR